MNKERTYELGESRELLRLDIPVRSQNNGGGPN